jgi:hypothetical protein
LLFNFRRQEFHHIVLGLWEMKAILETHLESFVNLRFHMFQITCAHDGCNAKVHRDCQRHWITLAQLPHIESIPTYCPTHNRQRGDYIAWYYETKKQPIPDSLTITTSKDVGESKLRAYHSIHGYATSNHSVKCVYVRYQPKRRTTSSRKRMLYLLDGYWSD